MELKEIRVDLIDRNPNNPRVYFDEVALGELAESIRVHGVIQPIEVEATADGRYRLHHGERRWRASALAGRETIRAVIAPPRGGEEDRVRALLENLHREDLNPIEEAQVFRDLMDSGWTITRIVRETGVSQPTVSSRLVWLEMEPEIQRLVALGHLPRSAELAREFRRLTPEVRVPLAAKLAEKALSLTGCVAAVRRAAEKIAQKQVEKPKTVPHAWNPAERHPVPMVRYGAPDIPVKANGSAPATVRSIHEAADAMCRTCYLRPRGDVLPSWGIIEAEAAAVCEACQKKDGPALPDVCKVCPGVAMLRALIGRTGAVKDNPES